METEPTTETPTTAQTDGESGVAHPRIVRRPSALLGVATLAARILGGPTLSVMEFPRMAKGPAGREMKQVGKTESGDDILEDHGGRQYTRDRKGTIRRFKANTATMASEGLPSVHGSGPNNDR
jgi:hypothetical protein